MRKIKIWMPVVAIIGAAFILVASAFTKAPAEKAVVYKFWSIVDPAHPEEPSNYQEITQQEFDQLSCSGSSTICKMEAQDDGGQPIFNVDQNNLPVVDNNYVLERTLRN